MKQCDNCSEVIEARAFCNQRCKRQFYRRGDAPVPGEVQESDNKDVIHVPREVQKDVIHVPSEVQNDYIEEQRECVFCNRKYPVNEDGNVYCKKCKQATIYNQSE